MTVALVVAISENNAIGKDNQLLWHLPADLKHFKAITTGHTLIMGRKTFDSIGKPLPNRRNIVISRNAELTIAGAEVYQNLAEALQACAHEAEIYIIGGAEIFNQSIQLANKIYLTRVHQTYEADTFFPELDSSQWEESNLEQHLPDEKNTVAYTFSILESK